MTPNKDIDLSKYEFFKIECKLYNRDDVRANNNQQRDWIGTVCLRDDGYIEGFVKDQGSPADIKHTHVVIGTYAKDMGLKLYKLDINHSRYTVLFENYLNNNTFNGSYYLISILKNFNLGQSEISIENINLSNAKKINFIEQINLELNNLLFYENTRDIVLNNGGFVDHRIRAIRLGQLALEKGVPPRKVD